MQDDSSQYRVPILRLSDILDEGQDEGVVGGDTTNDSADTAVTGTSWHTVDESPTPTAAAVTPQTLNPTPPTPQGQTVRSDRPDAPNTPPQNQPTSPSTHSTAQAHIVRDQPTSTQKAPAEQVPQKPQQQTPVLGVEQPTSPAPQDTPTPPTSSGPQISAPEAADTSQSLEQMAQALGVELTTPLPASNEGVTPNTNSAAQPTLQASAAQQTETPGPATAPRVPQEPTTPNLASVPTTPPTPTVPATSAHMVQQKEKDVLNDEPTPPFVGNKVVETIHATQRAVEQHPNTIAPTADAPQQTPGVQQKAPIRSWADHIPKQYTPETRPVDPLDIWEQPTRRAPTPPAPATPTPPKATVVNDHVPPPQEVIVEQPKPATETPTTPITPPAPPVHTEPSIWDTIDNTPHSGHKAAPPITELLSRTNNTAPAGRAVTQPVVQSNETAKKEVSPQDREVQVKPNKESVQKQEVPWQQPTPVPKKETVPETATTEDLSELLANLAQTEKEQKPQATQQDPRPTVPKHEQVEVGPVAVPRSTPTPPQRSEETKNQTPPSEVPDMWAGVEKAPKKEEQKFQQDGRQHVHIEAVREDQQPPTKTTTNLAALRERVMRESMEHPKEKGDAAGADSATTRTQQLAAVDVPALQQAAKLLLEKEGVEKEHVEVEKHPVSTKHAQAISSIASTLTALTGGEQEHHKPQPPTTQDAAPNTQTKQPTSSTVAAEDLNTGTLPLMRTFKQDVQQTMMRNKTSVVDMISAGERKRAVGDVVIRTAERSSWLTPSLYVLLGISTILVVGAIAAAVMIFMPSSSKIEAARYFVPDELIEQDVTDRTREALLIELLRTRDDISVRYGYATQVVLTEKVVLPLSNDTEIVALTAQRLFRKLEVVLPNTLDRSLEKDFMFGYLGLEQNQPYLVLQSNYFEGAFSGMLDWEVRMPSDLDVLFPTGMRVEGETKTTGPASFAATTTSTSSRASTPQTSNFEDSTVANLPARTLRNAEGSEVLVWSMPDDRIVIAPNAEVLRRIVDRINARAL